MIRFDNVHLRYPYDEFELLKGVNLQLDGAVSTVLCDGQSGKTSLCKLLMRQVQPTSGQILLDGAPISSITPQHLGILYLSDKPVFFERRSVADNIAYPLKLRKMPRQQRLEAAKQAAARFGFDPSARAKFLSAADRRKLALARGLTAQRNIVLFDDFFSDDSAGAVNDVLALFDGAMCIIFTSNPALATGNCAVLDNGITVYSGNADGARACVDSLQWTVAIRS